MGTALPARIRAARGYANMSQEDLSRVLGISDQTIKRRENPEESDPKPGELIAIAHATGVPVAFLKHGFPPDLPENYRDEVTSQLAELAEQIEWVEQVLVGLAAALRVELPARPQTGKRRRDAS